ncbi:MAG: Type I restriction-modification system, specificity subunit S [Nitrospira sp.]|jgi:type I restriction enzyme S subunit|nr:Type I restriction-modification system, specificity subunit S [Nitrospira sp.]
MKLVPLNEVADIQLGKMLSPKAKAGESPFPYLRNQNVQWGRINLSDLAVMHFSAREREKFELRSGDLLVCEGGEPGRCAVWGQSEMACYYQKALHRIRPREGMADSEFLSLWLRYQAYIGSFEDQNAKTTISHLPLVRLQQLQVPTIPIVTQQRIAAQLKAQLAAVEQARQAAQAEVQELTNLANAIVHESLDHAEVETTTLGHGLDEIKQGIGETWAQYPVLGATRDGLALAKEPVGKKPGRYKPVWPGTVFYNPMRILIGSIAMVDAGDTPGITSPDYVVLKGRENIMDSRWFYYWLRSPHGERCILSLARGAVRERMLFNRLAEGKIEIPPYPVQLAASRALAQIRPLEAKIEMQLSEIEVLPTRLLAQTFQD